MKFCVKLQHIKARESKKNNAKRESSGVRCIARNLYLRLRALRMRCQFVFERAARAILKKNVHLTNFVHARAAELKLASNRIGALKRAAVHTLHRQSAPPSSARPVRCGTVARAAAPPPRRAPRHRAPHTPLPPPRAGPAAYPRPRRRAPHLGLRVGVRAQCVTPCAEAALRAPP